MREKRMARRRDETDPSRVACRRVPVVHTVQMSLEDHQIELRDGRQLGYVEAGDPDGHPIFYFHGFPGSRLEIELSGVDVAPLGARLIGVDRPGMGLSDFAPHRYFGDWPEDVSQLADALGLDHFSVVGVSGGGPYVAAWVPTWVTARVLDAPTEKFQQRMARTLPTPDRELIEQRPDIAETGRAAQEFEKLMACSCHPFLALPWFYRVYEEELYGDYWRFPPHGSPPSA
jgi:pimeloyl-ACP methyl ester carboxylesterase